MKHIRYLFTIVFITSGIVFSQPKLSIDKPELNLGVIYSGMKKQGKIILKNIGNDTLRIFSVRPSCGCTTVKEPKKFLLPNESDEAEVEFNSISYHGNVVKYINIATNDPTSQHVSVKFIVEVKDELRPTNMLSSLWFGDIGIGKTSVQKTSLVNVSDHRIKIKGFRISSPTITLQAEKKSLKPNDTLHVLVTVKPEKIGYYRDDNFVVETDSENQPDIEIKVNYRCTKEN
jgi:hypothetical protein